MNDSLIWQHKCLLWWLLDKVYLEPSFPFSRFVGGVESVDIVFAIGGITQSKSPIKVGHFKLIQDEVEFKILRSFKMISYLFIF